jgi:hypothetical protein
VNHPVVDRSSGQPHVSFTVVGKRYHIYLEDGFEKQYAAAPQTGDLILSGLPGKLRASTETRAVLISRSGITELPSSNLLWGWGVLTRAVSLRIDQAWMVYWSSRCVFELRVWPSGYLKKSTPGSLILFVGQILGLALLHDSLTVCDGQGKLWFYRLKHFAGSIGLLDKPSESAWAIFAQFQNLVFVGNSIAHRYDNSTPSLLVSMTCLMGEKSTQD